MIKSFSKNSLVQNVHLGGETTRSMVILYLILYGYLISYLVFNCIKIHQRKRQLFNPLSPDIKMHFPLAVLHTFIMELVS